MVINSRMGVVNRVILSIGHDPKSVGVVNSRGEKENDIARKIAEITRDYLLLKGVNVILLEDLTLSETIAQINKIGKRSDIAIEVHKDSFGEAWDENKMRRRVGLYYFAGSAGSQEIARGMVNHMKSKGGHDTSWVRMDTESPRKRLGFVRDTSTLSYIYEGGGIEGDNCEYENTWYGVVLGESILKVMGKIE